MELNRSRKQQTTNNKQQTTNNMRTKTSRSLIDAVINAATIAPSKHKARPRILGDFFLKGDIGCINGPTGSGRSWTALAMANSFTAGDPVGTWDIPRPMKVLFLDATARLEDFVKRLSLLTSNPSDDLYVLSNRDICINFADETCQEELATVIREREIDVLIIDDVPSFHNSMTGHPCGKPWLRSLSLNGLSIVLTGASDAFHSDASWILELSSVKSVAGGIKITAGFKKNHHAPSDISSGIVLPLIHPHARSW